NLDNIVRNNGEAVPANLSDNSYGYVVVLGDLGCDLIGNFRIIDDSGYEYRTNMANAGYLPFPLLQEAADFITQDNPGVWEATVISDNPPPLYANFNTVDGANLSDVVGFSYFINTNLNQFLDTDDSPDAVVNYSDGVSFDIFVFDMNEDPLSCDSTV
ncbi:MAG: hypothetical protein GTO02_21980, partial [Candidatus Dadabacteria bacterium]|nr:hypothetical protein [Candidatus Dadabacteria bacterium]NIQ16955.1 hypothetical protein [Candidatus Dadabacteria bacterium]